MTENEMSSTTHSLRVLAEGFAYDTEQPKHRLRQLDDLIEQGLAFVNDQYLDEWARRVWTVREIALTDAGKQAAAAFMVAKRGTLIRKSNGN